MELYIIAGLNGVGKTTFARTFLPKYADCKNFINADLIAQGMSPFSPESCSGACWPADVEQSVFLHNGEPPLLSRQPCRVGVT
jgi:predicted ABC-type ATPase